MTGVFRRVASLRARATLVGVLAVSVALCLGAVGLVSELRSAMTEGIEVTARSQLDDVASLLRAGTLPAQLPAGRGDTITQIVGAGGRVLAWSSPSLSTSPISRAQPGEEGVQLSRVDGVPGAASGADAQPEGPFLVLAQRVPAEGLSVGGADGQVASALGSTVTVYVAATLHPVDQATATVAWSLAAGLPVVIGLVAILIWLLAGRTLRPVEAIREEVADISGDDLHRRVPVPDSHDEVARLAETMNEMLDRLQAAADAQRRFVSDASHELRSPLAVLQATLEIALAHPGDIPWPVVASDALGEAGRLQGLVEDLLLLASLENGSQSRRQEDVDLDEVVMEEIRRRRPTSRVVFDPSRVSAARVDGNRRQLARVVQNLIDNAERHAAGVVTVELSEEDGSARLVVADDGPGIPPGRREWVFDRFARIDEARSLDAGGSGLGLAITREIVLAHGGGIRVADSNLGARLEVVLPCAVDDQDEPDIGVSRQETLR